MSNKVKKHGFFHLPDLNNIPRTIRKSCETTKHYQVSDHLLGEGTYGRVLSTCNDKVCDFVAKILTFDFSRYEEHYVYNLFFAESSISKFAGEKKFGIPVHDYFLCDNGEKGVVIMDKFDGDLESIRFSLTYEDYKQLFDKIQIMHSYGILHRDLFLKNVMFRKLSGGTKDIRIIDFGLSIPFEKSIPGPFRAVDFLNILSDIPDKSLRKKCLMYVDKLIGKKNMEIAQLWEDTHINSCSSEYNLLKYLPDHLFIQYGPATVDLLVWSVRCNRELDKDIINKTNEKMKSVFKKYKLRKK